MSDERFEALEISVYTKDFVHALSFANSIIEKKSIINELSNIKISIANNILRLYSTDMELYLQQELPVESFSAWETTVKASVLLDIARKINDTKTKLIYFPDQNKLQIKGEMCEFELTTLPANNFRTPESITSGTQLNILASELAKSIEYTQFSISQEETRYQLGGIFFQSKPGMLIAASTDGHRLSTLTINLPENQNIHSIIAPKKTCTELLKILKDTKNNESMVEIILAEHFVQFSLNNLILTSKIIDAEYPQYEAFIPKDNPNKLRINTKLFSEAIDRVSIVTLDKFRAVKFILTQQSFTLIAAGETKAAATEVLEYSTDSDKFCQYNGDELTIAFNPTYISQLTSAIREKEIEIFFGSELDPILIQVADSEQCRFVLMPFRAV